MKCGQQIPDDANFCRYCGNQIINYSQKEDEIQRTDLFYEPVYPLQQTDSASQYVYQTDTMPVNTEIRTQSEPILYGKEFGLVIATGLAYIIAGAITAILYLTTDSLSFLFKSEDMEVLFQTSVFLGVIINLIFGVGIIMKKRWAALTTRVFMIIGAVVNVIMIFYLLAQIGEFKSIPSEIAMYKIDYSPLFGILLNVAYDIAMIVFTSIIAKVLSQEVQNYRRKHQNQKAQYNRTDNQGEDKNALQEESDYQNFWVCKKCGSHNKIGSSSCKDCGSYK